MRLVSISASVGYGGRNISSDVLTIQRLLNANRTRVAAMKQLEEDGRIGAKTRTAIVQFQQAVLGFQDGRVDVNGKTFNALRAGAGGSIFTNAGSTAAASGGNSAAGRPSIYGGTTATPYDFMGAVGTNVPETPMAPEFFTFPYFYHEGHSEVTLLYDPNSGSARKMTSTAEQLLKCILASCNIRSATLTSTHRTYHDQARITLTETYPKRRAAISQWYGSTVSAEVEKYRDPLDIQGFADWWEAHDRRRGRVSSRHLTNQALDVVPAQSRGVFANKVKELVGVSGSGVRKIIPKGTLNEPVDHVEFHFKVCPV